MGDGAAGSDGGVGGGSGGGPAGGPIDGPPPAPVGFTMTEAGGYKLGDPIVGNSPTNTPTGDPQQTCNTIVGIVRDFKGITEPNGHPDFESFEGRGPTKGLVAAVLGPDHKPVYASHCEEGTTDKTACPSGQMTTSQALFDQWFNNVDGVNMAFRLELLMSPGMNGLGTFQSSHYFPLGSAGWGYSGKDDTGAPQNFGFTTELHTTFQYNGGEQFTFAGDDDLWVFINGQLAIDLGGLHFPETGTIDVDKSAATFAMTVGNVYPLDLFQAERHSIGSDVRIDTNFKFVSCGTLIP